MKKNHFMGVGIDLISITRLKNIKKNDFSHWKHVFTAYEWNYAFSKNKKAASYLAEMFAVKEAAMKACRLVGVKNFKRFRVRYTKSGVPLLNRRGVLLAVSHDKDRAFAVVIV